MKSLFTFLILAFTTAVFCQNLTSVIKGTIKDKETIQPIIGAKIELLNQPDFFGTVSDFSGGFRLTNVPVGKQTIVITFVGYEPVFIRNIEVSSKEVVLEIDMTEKIEQMKEVVVTGRRKGETINKMVSVSARSFSVDESKRYAGSLNDVARMARNFAGVQGGDDSRNDLIIRGNSPTGVLYRLEGIDIPNPNHFARFGTTGGPVSMLNNNVLSNSDFLTGAFPAEYGNAIAGVFDLSMRNGNNGKHEFMFQLGFNGAELLAEGPISKKQGSSYLVSYRYNDLIVLKKLGLDIGTSAVPRHQDLSFKFNFPWEKGVTSIYGIGGISTIDILGAETSGGDLYAIDNSDTYYTSTVGIVGVRHKQRLGKSAYLNFSSALQTGINEIRNDTLDADFENPFTNYINESAINKWTNNVFVNKKFSAKHVLKSGIQADIYILNLHDSVYVNQFDQFVSLRNFNGNTLLIQPYAQYQFRPNRRLNVNLGLHYQLITLGNNNVLEPRAGMRWSVTEKDQLTFGYGLHSQMQPLEFYFVESFENGEIVRLNQNIDFSKSHHFIIGYERFFKHYISAKVEAYYQSLFDVVVDQTINSFSMSNYGSSFVERFPIYATNEGTGENYGIDFTVEKNLNKGFYFLITSSVYQSYYTGSNGIEFNTAFNGNYTFNALSGYEYKFKSAKKSQASVSIDLKFIRNGGKRYTPILLEESIATNNEVRDFSQAFTKKYPDYTKGDLRIGFKMVGKKVTQEWALDIQNFTNQQNIFLQQFSQNTQSIATTYQTGRLPIGQYRIYF